MNTSLAVDIGGTKTSIALVFEETVLRKFSWQTPTHADQIRASILANVAEFMTDRSFDVCGVGFGGQFDYSRQTVIRSVHVPGWDGVPLSDWIAEHLGVPVVADNDANTAGLGEAAYGAGRSADRLVYLTISTGIGGAIITHGKVRRGSNSLAAEFGHITLDPSGPECGCGLRGCAERMLSGLWLERDHGIPPKELFTGEQFSTDYSRTLARLLLQVIMVLDPDRIVLGGGIGASSPQIAALAESELRRQLAPWRRATPQVRTAELGGNSVLIGAGKMARERYGSA